MARPKLGQSETERLHIKITADEIGAIDDWRFANRIPSRSEAVRRLVQIGLRFDKSAEGLESEVRSIMERVIEAVNEIDGALSKKPRRYDYAAVHGAALAAEMLEEHAKLAEKIISLSQQSRLLKFPSELSESIKLADKIKESLDSWLEEIEKKDSLE